MHQVGSPEAQMADDDPTWQCAMVCWGDRYGVDYLNTLVAAVRRHARSTPRFCLITDAAKPGLDPDVRFCRFPEFFLQENFRGSGCQAKLAMFEAGVLPDDLPTVYVDLDTVILGDIGPAVDMMRDCSTILMLHSAIVPFGAVGRTLARLTNGRRYARGNSSVIAFHPAECGYVAARFRQMWAQHEGRDFKPLRADERFISWVAQPQMAALPSWFAVKFTGEYMSRIPLLLYVKARLPWVKRRRARQVAITLNDPSIKPEEILALPEGGRITDRKGRVLIWSASTLGPMQDRLRSFYSGFLS
jgi:hypothetical protein